MLNPAAPLQKLLLADEQVLWSDAPQPWRFAGPSFVIYVFAVPWTIFTFWWFYFVTDGFRWLPPANPPYPPWTPRFFAGTALLAFLPGVIMLTSPFWAWRKALRTIYAVTSLRVLKIDTAKLSKIESLELAGKFVVRVKDPQAVCSDLEFAVGEKGLILRAVPRAGEVVRQLQQTSSEP